MDSQEGAGLDGVVTERRDPAETDTFLPAGRSNGTAVGSDHRADSQRNGGEEHKFHQGYSVSRVREQLQEIVFWRVRLWMVIVFIFLLILAVILISLASCSAIQSDEDEEFDLSLFKTPQYFNGSFKLLNLSSTESQVSLELQEKVKSFLHFK
ncbi:unnamed protein product [Menidia menidia]|uniref:(Atlantic silverside) hypothetical protein n=1 Tax=Menidia menidia TaxID=238744 RepID=A0A8S4BQM4_9TELE|nr:unnamed protein product [Menidia menidia]